MIPPEEVLHTLIISIAVLLGISMAFAGIVVYLHFRNKRKARLLSSLESQWEVPLMEALAGGPAFETAALVTPEHRLAFVRFLLKFARRLRGDERHMIQQLAAPLLVEVAERTRSNSSEVRAQAIMTLTFLGMPRFAPQVVRALDDPSQLVAMTAARGLARPEYAEYAPEVLARVGRFSQWSHRFLAAMLSSMGEAAVPTLRSVLANTQAEPESRAIAAEALSQLRDLHAADIAAHILQTEKDRQLLSAALGLLGVVGHSGHLLQILPLLESSESWVRAQAVETLARLGTASDAPLLNRSLEDESPWVALRAAYGLKELGATETLLTLAGGTDRRATLAREVLSGTA